MTVPTEAALAFDSDQIAWSYREGNDCWLYCDGENYFKALVAACEAAQSHICILGWDFHNATRLLPAIELAEGDPRRRLDSFLRYLLESRSSLHIYLLIWDYASIYVFEREKLPGLRMALQHHPRLHYQLDSQHPVGASHHEKLVVIDGQLAFLGGLDLTTKRWDSCQHRAVDPLRQDPAGESYQPFHDLQLGISGLSARDLLRLFCERWQRASGSSLALEAPPSEMRLPPVAGEAIAAFRKVRVALSLTYPAFRDYPSQRQILELYLSLIRCARHHILLESQYLTSAPIVEVLAQRVAEADAPEIVLILPERMGPWLEKQAMTRPQMKALKKILAQNSHQRVHIVYPYDQQLRSLDRYVTVHSKLMIIDDVYLAIGSANLNNRSMGLDSECNATLDGRGDPDIQFAIRQTLVILLAHYSEVSWEIALSTFVETGSLYQVMARLQQGSPQRHLAPLKIDSACELPVSWFDPALLDMEGPSALEIAMDRWGRMSEAVTKHLGVSPRLLSQVHAAVLLVATGGIWIFSPWGEGFGRGPWDGMTWLVHNEMSVLLLIPLIYGIGCLLFFPVNLLIIVTASLFPLLWGWAYIVLGVTADVVAAYGLGRFAGYAFFKQFFGPRTSRVLLHIGKGEFAALVLLRMIPIAPHALVNLAAGASRIPFFKFLAATLIGMAPGTLALVLFQRSILLLLRHPSWVSVSLCLLWAAAFWGIFRWLRRRFSNYGS